MDPRISTEKIINYEFYVKGLVAMTGNEPYTVLVLRSKKGVYLIVGDLKDELTKLQGRRVAIEGVLSREKGFIPGSIGSIYVKQYKLE